MKDLHKQSYLNLLLKNLLCKCKHENIHTHSNNLGAETKFNEKFDSVFYIVWSLTSFDNIHEDTTLRNFGKPRKEISTLFCM